MPLWDINPNGTSDNHKRVAAPSPIQACRAKMPDREFELQYQTRECCHVVEAGGVVTHDVFVPSAPCRRHVPTSLDAFEVFNGSRDFLVGYETLKAKWTANAWPVMRSAAVCLSLAIELALKCHAVLDGNEPLKNRDGHNYLKLYAALLPETQLGIARAYADVPGREMMSIPLLSRALHHLNRTFETWRYLFERREGATRALNVHRMEEVTWALHEAALRRKPEWRAWIGRNG